MACPEVSSLQSFCLGIQLADFCQEDDNGQFGPIVFTVKLINPSATQSYIQDPTNCSFITPGVVYQETWDTGENLNGCVTTCPLFPNTADDPDQALQPSGTYYQISLIHRNTVVLAIDALYLDLEDAVAAAQQNFDGTTCIDICELLDAPATIPTTDAFCDAVRLCETPWTGIAGTGGISVIAGDNPNGNTGNGHQPTISINPATVVDNGDGTYTFTSNDGSVQIIDTNQTVTVTANGDGTATISDDTGTSLNVWLSSTTDALVDNGDGTATHTSMDGTVETLDICQMIRDGGCYATLTEDAIAGTWTFNNGVDAPTVIGPLLETAAFGVDGATNVNTLTVVDTAGTTVIYLESISTLVANPNGSHTYTDEGGNVTTIPAGATYDLENNIDQADGTVDFTGSDGSTDTLLINSQDGNNLIGYGADGGLSITCADVGSCFTVTTDTTALGVTNDGAGNIDITLISGDGGQVLTIGTDGGLLLTDDVLVDNGDGSFTHTSVGGTATTITICDLIDDLPAAGTPPVTGATLVGIDPGGACTLYDPPIHTFELGQGGTTFADAGAVTDQHRWYTGSTGIRVEAAYALLGTAHTQDITVEIAVAGAVVQTVTIPAGATEFTIPAGGYVGVTHAAGASVQERVTSLNGGTGGTEFVLLTEYTRA